MAGGGDTVVVIAVAVSVAVAVAVAVAVVVGGITVVLQLQPRSHKAVREVLAPLVGGNCKPFLLCTAPDPAQMSFFGGSNIGQVVAPSWVSILNQELNKFFFSSTTKSIPQMIYNLRGSFGAGREVGADHGEFSEGGQCFSAKATSH